MVKISNVINKINIIFFLVIKYFMLFKLFNNKGHSWVDIVERILLDPGSVKFSGSECDINFRLS